MCNKGKKVSESEFRMMVVLPWEVCQLCTHRSKVAFRWLNSIRPNRLDTLVRILIRFRPVLHRRQSVSVYPGLFLTGITKQPGTQKLNIRQKGEEEQFDIFTKIEISADVCPDVLSRITC
jgi:hypothetical protein